MESRKISSKRILELIDILPVFSNECGESIEASADLITKCFLGGGKLLICGNGGSAADSQHFAAEFMSSFSREIFRQGLPAIALSVDTSFITAYSNDFRFDGIFSRQVEALGRPGDILIALTTSGSSDNCLQAVYKAKEKGLSTIAFTRTSGVIASKVDICIEVPSINTQHIQECHMVAYHVISELVEESLFGKSTK